MSRGCFGVDSVCCPKPVAETIVAAARRLRQVILKRYRRDVRSHFDQISLSLQVEAQMAPLEKTTPMYTEDVDDVVYLSDHESVLAVLNKLRGSVGLGAMPVIQQAEEPDEGEEAAQIEDKATA